VGGGIPIKFPLFSSSFEIVPIKFLVFPSITHQNPFVLKQFLSNSSCSHQQPITFLLFPTQPYINPHKALTFGIKRFFCNLKTCRLIWFHNEKVEKNVIKKKRIFLRNTVHVWCAVRKWLWRMGAMFFFFVFWVLKFW
jgi:hypothetical protein